MTLANVSTLSGSVVRTLRGGEGSLKIVGLVTSSLGHLRSQFSIVYSTYLERGHRDWRALSDEVFVQLTRRAGSTASARLLMALQSLDQ